MGISQDITLEKIRASYSLGERIKKLIEQKDVAGLKAQLGETDQTKRLISLLQSEKSTNNAYKIFSDIYYNPDINKFVFTIYKSKWIKTESDWGLNDYAYVAEFAIPNNSLADTSEIKLKKASNQASDLKTWWRSLMRSYRLSKFQRKKWADNYGLVPPPPPPPQSTEWFSK